MLSAESGPVSSIYITKVFHGARSDEWLRGTEAVTDLSKGLNDMRLSPTRSAFDAKYCSSVTSIMS